LDAANARAVERNNTAAHIADEAFITGYLAGRGWAAPNDPERSG
jgi:hypothetical protein